MKARKGIVLAGGSGSRLYPLTVAVSKQLMPVYDKPMIYYPISVLMLAGIRDILVITTPQDRALFERLLGDGSQWGIHIAFATQPSPDGIAQAVMIGESFLDGAPVALILGDNLFYGANLAATLRHAAADSAHATIFSHHVANPSAYGVVEFAADGTVLSIEEKPPYPESNYAITGVYFLPGDAPAVAATLAPSARGELEITDLIRRYLDDARLRVETLGRGTAWLDTGTHASLLEAAEFVAVIEERQGLKIACLEEIALRLGWIDRATFDANIARMGDSHYAAYLRAVRDQRNSQR